MQRTRTFTALDSASVARRWARFACVLAVVGNTACGTASEPSFALRDPTTPMASLDTSLQRVEVTTATTGVRLDSDGYGVLNDEWDYDVGDGVTAAVPTNGIVTLYLRAGRHVLSLVSVASNCSGEDLDDRPVVVSMGAATTVPFSVVCR